MSQQIIKQLRSALATFAAAGMIVVGGGFAVADQGCGGDGGPDMVVKSDSVAARLGGYQGILNFLDKFAVPALLADQEIAFFFQNLSESPADIEQCLAMLLDHDLGGSSPHNGAVLASGHECRSSMSNIHRGRNIPDRIVTKFINIVGQQAAIAGVAQADIQAVAKVLERYRGGVRNN